MVRLLLDRGADVKMLDRYGKTPLYKAAMFGHSKVVKLLLDGDANIGAGGSDRRTPLH